MSSTVFFGAGGDGGETCGTLALLGGTDGEAGAGTVSVGATATGGGRESGVAGAGSTITFAGRIGRGAIGSGLGRAWGASATALGAASGLALVTETAASALDDATGDSGDGAAMLSAGGRGATGETALAAVGRGNVCGASLPNSRSRLSAIKPPTTTTPPAMIKEARDLGLLAGTRGGTVDTWPSTRFAVWMGTAEKAGSTSAATGGAFDPGFAADSVAATGTDGRSTKGGLAFAATPGAANSGLLPTSSMEPPASRNASSRSSAACLMTVGSCFVPLAASGGTERGKTGPDGRDPAGVETTAAAPG